MSLTPAMIARLSKRGLVQFQDKSEKLSTDLGNEYFDRSKLPANWEEVIDEKTGYPYYWNTDTDNVQWDPPEQEQILVQAAISYDLKQVSQETESRSHLRSHSERSNKSERSKYKDRHRPYDRSERKKERKDEDEDGGDGDELDPMDPSSYSDIPRGSWASGLPTKGQGRLAADETASGPLFQMRPYPNPGAVLRSQKPPSEFVGPNLPEKYSH